MSSADSRSVSAAYGSHNSATGNRSPVGWYSTIAAADDDDDGNIADGSRVLGIENVYVAKEAAVARTPSVPVTAHVLDYIQCVKKNPP